MRPEGLASLIFRLTEEQFGKARPIRPRSTLTGGRGTGLFPGRDAALRGAGTVSDAAAARSAAVPAQAGSRRCAFPVKRVRVVRKGIGAAGFAIGKANFPPPAAAMAAEKQKRS